MEHTLITSPEVIPAQIVLDRIVLEQSGALKRILRDVFKLHMFKYSAVISVFIPIGMCMLNSLYTIYLEKSSIISWYNNYYYIPNGISQNLFLIIGESIVLFVYKRTFCLENRNNLYLCVLLLIIITFTNLWNWSIYKNSGTRYKI